MITREQGLRKWADQWRTLRAWKRDLSGVKIEISDRWWSLRLGTCWDYEQRVVIYRGDSFVDELSTILHELAHAACIGSGHDEKWQTTFASAVTEVTNISVVPMADSYRILNLAAKSAISTWWQLSGNAKLWSLASTGVNP